MELSIPRENLFSVAYREVYNATEVNRNVKITSFSGSIFHGEGDVRVSFTDGEGVNFSLIDSIHKGHRTVEVVFLSEQIQLAGNMSNIKAVNKLKLQLK